MRWVLVRCSLCRNCLLHTNVNDIGLWELNGVCGQVIYCRDKLGIDNDKLNVDGGAIAIGHPTE